MIFQPDNLARTFNLLNNLMSLSSEFKNVLNESRIGAEEPIDRPYREVHVLEKGYLQIRLEHDKRALVESEVYRLWQERNNYVYENDAAPQLEVDMDSFKCGTETQAEIRQSYVALESFQNRFQQNRTSGIISFQEYEQRENALTEEEKRQIQEYEKQRDALIEENRLESIGNVGILLFWISVSLFIIGIIFSVHNSSIEWSFFGFGIGFGVLWFMQTFIDVKEKRTGKGSD